MAGCEKGMAGYRGWKGIGSCSREETAEKTGLYQGARTAGTEGLQGERHCQSSQYSEGGKYQVMIS